MGVPVCGSGRFCVGLWGFGGVQRRVVSILTGVGGVGVCAGVARPSRWTERHGDSSL